MALEPARRGWLPRIEDWLLAGWVALVAPALIQLRPSSAGPFDPGRPLDGFLGLVAIAGAAACLATRSANDPAGVGLSRSAAVGPFVGGLLLTIASTAAALELSEATAIAAAVAVAVVAVIVRVRWPAPPALVRRALVTPYILVAGGLFWDLIGAVTGGGDLPAGIRQAATTDVRAVLPITGFLLAFSAVYYAMLVYAPRHSWRCARSQRARASSMAVARAAKVWLLAAAKILPGRGHRRSPRPSTRSTRIDSQLRVICVSLQPQRLEIGAATILSPMR